MEEEKVELELIGEIDHVKIYYDPLMPEKTSTTGYEDAILPPAGNKMKACDCDKCKCFTSARRALKTYASIRFQIMGTKDMEVQRKSLEKHRNYLESEEY